MRFFEIMLGAFCGVIFVITLYTLTIPNIDINDIGKPCKQHQGVQQVVPSGVWNSSLEKNIVICRDGSIAEIE